MNLQVSVDVIYLHAKEIDLRLNLLHLHGSLTRFEFNYANVIACTGGELRHFLSGLF